MKKLNPFIVALCVAGAVSAPIYAESNAALKAQLAQLEKEVNLLKTQINQVQVEPTTSARAHHKVRRIHRHGVNQLAHEQEAHQMAVVQDGQDQSAAHETKRIRGGNEFLPIDISVPGQSFVSTGPYLGVPIQFAGSNLFINSPSINTDVQLLNTRKAINTQLQKDGDLLSSSHSHLLFSGVVEGQGNYTNRSGGPSSTNIDVTNVAIDSIFMGPSNWTMGLIEMAYDNNAPNASQYISNSNYRVSNARVFINKAFITIGDFTQSPYYATIGQLFVPFGSYSSTTIGDTLPKLLGRVKGRAIVIGAQQQSQNGFYGAGYLLRGSSYDSTVAKVRNGGMNVGYKFKADNMIGSIGGGVIENIADSGGMQVGANFQDVENIQHRVPAMNLRGNLSVGNHWDFIAEFVGATKRFSPLDLSYNNKGAKPSAFDMQASYSFTILNNKPSAIGVDFGKSYNALGVGLPLTRTAVVFNTSWFRNTLQSIEVRHDRQYASSAVATMGGGVVVPSQSGRADNAITAQFDYYF